MIRHQFHLTGKFLLVMILTACVAACGRGQATSDSSSPATTNSSAPSSQQGTPTVHSTAPPTDVTVPLVSGQYAQIAEQHISATGLDPVTQPEPNLSYPANVVIATAPSEGTAVLTGEAVTLYISEGLAGCEGCIRRAVYAVMPNVCGLTYQQANTLLAENGITLSEQTISQASPEPAGIIIGSIPTVGATFVSFGSIGFDPEAVVVAISSGQTALVPPPTPGSPDTCSAISSPSSSPGISNSPGSPD